MTTLSLHFKDLFHVSGWWHALLGVHLPSSYEPMVSFVNPLNNAQRIKRANPLCRECVDPDFKHVSVSSFLHLTLRFERLAIK